MAKELSFGLDRTGNTKYPWDQWTNGKAWLLVRGEDFTCGVESLRSAIHQYATRHDLSVVTRKPSPADIARLRGKNEMQAAMSGMTDPREGLIVQFMPDLPDDAVEVSSPPKKPKRALKKLKRRPSNVAK